MRSTAIEYPYCTPAAELEALIRDGFVPNDPTYTQTLHPEFELRGGVSKLARCDENASKRREKNLKYLMDSYLKQHARIWP
jgi:hypothetical protein